jgi:hypothetical protein
MIKEKGLVVPLKDMFTHPPILLQNDITMSRKDIPRSRAARNVLIQTIAPILPKSKLSGSSTAREQQKRHLIEGECPLLSDSSPL